MVFLWYRGFFVVVFRQYMGIVGFLEVFIGFFFFFVGKKSVGGVLKNWRVNLYGVFRCYFWSRLLGFFVYKSFYMVFFI